jgi:esterase/lipase superfamily enzyme
MAAVIGDESVFPKDEEKRSTGDLLVFVHGYNNDQNIVMERHRRLRKDLQERGFKGAVVSFDWPSANSALNYLEDRSDAKQTALQLVTDCILPFSRYQQANCRINVHILAHSTGAFVLREAFDDADDRPHIAAVNWTVSQVLFIGADISSSSMSAANPTTSSLRRHCVRLTNYWNPYDSVLKLSNAKRVGLAPRVGRVGLPQDAPPHFVDVDCGEYWQETQKKRNAKSVIGDLGHSWHIGDPVFTQDLLYTLQGDIDRNAIPTRSSVADNDLKLKAA